MCQNSFEGNTFNSVNNIIDAFLSKMDVEIGKTLQRIASEMQPKEISLEKEFNECFLSATINRIKNSIDVFMRETHSKKIEPLSVSAVACDPIVTESPKIVKPNEEFVTPVQHKYLDIYKDELSKMKSKKLRKFIKANPGHDLNTPSMSVFGIGCRCHICFKSFKSLADLVAHREKSRHYLHPNTPECSRVLKFFELESYDSSDDESEYKLSPDSVRVKPIKCKFCPREFTQKTFLKKHEDKHTSQNDVKLNATSKSRPTTFRCADCSKQFSKKLLFVQHQKTHGKGKLSFRK